MREKGMRRVLVWFLLLALVMSQGNMVFAAKPVRPTPEPSSTLDITTGDLTLTVQENQVINFTVNASTKEEYAIIWGMTTSDYGLLSLTDTTSPIAKPGKKVTAYLQDATFLFEPSDVESDQTVVFTITAVKPDDSINKDQIKVTITVTPVEIQMNTPPVAVDDLVEGVVGSEILIQPLLNDTDSDGDVITLVSVKDEYGTDIPFEGSDIRFTPTAADTTILYYVISDGVDTAEGIIKVIVTGGTFVYVALGDSIPAGVSYEKSSTLKIIESYTDKIYNTLVTQYDNVEYYDTAISGMNIYSPTDNISTKEISLYDQVMFDNDIRSYIVSADLITLCIGANDIMDAAPPSTTGRDFYKIDWAKADSGLDNFYKYWDDIINELYNLNSEVELVVMNMYNPYKISDSNKNYTSHEVYGFNTMHFLVDKYFYSIEDLNPSNNDGIDYGLNYIIENPDKVYENFTHQYKVVNVYDHFEMNDPTKSKLIAFYDNNVTIEIIFFGISIPVQVLIKDPHPTLLGQTKLYELHATTMGW